MKIEVEIYEVKAGELRKLKYKDKIFLINEISSEDTHQESVPKMIEKSLIKPQQPEEKQVNQEIKSVYPEDDIKGKVIAQFGHNSIYENVYNDFKQSFLAGNSREELIDVLTYYYKKPAKSSIPTYLSVYTRFTRKQLNYPDVQIPTSKTPQLKQQKRRKKRRKKLSGEVGYDKIYNLHILEHELKKVKSAMNKWNEIHDFSQLQRDTGLKRERLYGILHWMIFEKGIAVRRKELIRYPDGRKIRGYIYKLI